MTHPPIPPRCEWFFVKTLSPNIYGYELGDDDWEPLTEETLAGHTDTTRRMWRNIVAAVAIVGWEDAKTIAPWQQPELWHGAITNLAPAALESHGAWDEICDDNAARWREWRAGK